MKYMQYNRKQINTNNYSLCVISQYDIFRLSYPEFKIVKISDNLCRSISARGVMFYLTICN